MHSLPPEIISRIGDYLPDKDLAHLAQVDSHLSQTLSHSLLKRALEDKPPLVIKIPALLWAIQFGHTRLVKKIVSQPNYTIIDHHLEALDLVAEYGHADMVPILISAGYEIGQSLHTAANNGNHSVLTELLNHGATIHHTVNGMTTLVSAIHAPWTRWIKTGATIKTKEAAIKFVKLIEADAVSTIRVLLSHGAHSDICTPDHEGNTPLHHAVLRCIGSVNDLRAGSGILRLLVDSGASLTARNNDDMTPLEVSVFHPTACTTTINFFLDIGLSPNTEFRHGGSLLSNSLTCNIAALPIIQLLLDRGAYTDGVDLFDFFFRQNEADPLFDKILTLLLIHGASFGDEASRCFTYGARVGMLDAMKTVLETCPGIDINTSVDPHGLKPGGTPLQFAISYGRADIVQFLVESGVKVSKQQKAQVESMLG
ncbi:hypothetical protein Q9L58_006534 [Maublancomyces gigas]|uniref:F-box domain-containing protein n=1 Tax=Discina gigas TaxID=1032678 RepID=A0ABR3GFA6_9PEZI